MEMRMCKTVKVIKLPQRLAQPEEGIREADGACGRAGGGPEGREGYGSETKASEKADPRCNCGQLISATGVQLQQPVGASSKAFADQGGFLGMSVLH